MSAAALKERLNCRPFEPFRVRLFSGDAYDVRHPEMALLLRNGMYVALPEAGGDELPESAVWCSLLHVAAVEPIATATGQSSRGNGAG
jgi:hypothetical protein